MKTLSTLMMSEFIDMSCGNLDVLKEDRESVTRESLYEKAKSVSYEYRRIVNPSECKSQIILQTQKTKREATITLYRICIAMIELGDGEKAKKHLSQIMNVQMEDSALKAKLTNDLRRLEFEKERYEAKNRKESEEVKGEAEIRSMFDRELASLMVFYKMSIDISAISASVYANMVSQANRQLLLRQSAVKKGNGY